MATIRKRPGPGGRRVWHVQIRKKGYPAQTRTFNRKAEAEAWASAVESEMNRGTYLPTAESERTTLGMVLKRYQEEVTPRKKGAEKEKSRIRRILADPIASRTLATLDGAAVAEFRDRRAQSVGDKTVRNDLALVRHVLQVADREWRMFLPRGNPVDSIRKPSLPRGRDRRLLPGEEKRLLAAARAYGGQIADLVIWALETAMRRGEIAAMRWGDLDRKAKVLSVPESKTGVPRRIPLSSRALAVLPPEPEIDQDSGLDARERYVWIMRADSITQAFERVVRRAREEYERECKKLRKKPDPKMLRDLRYHDLRHEATSRLFERGLNPMQVAVVTGHQTIGMLKRYTHLKAEDIVERLG